MLTYKSRGGEVGGDVEIVRNIMIGVTAITEPWKGVTANSQNDTEAERKQLLLLLAWHY